MRRTIKDILSKRTFDFCKDTPVIEAPEWLIRGIIVIRTIERDGYSRR